MAESPILTDYPIIEGEMCCPHCRRPMTDMGLHRYPWGECRVWFCSWCCENHVLLEPKERHGTDH